MVDEILSQEEDEFEALISLIDSRNDEGIHSPSNYGSDDEEYDDLFMNVVSNEEAIENRSKHHERNVIDEAMDISID